MKKRHAYRCKYHFVSFLIKSGHRLIWIVRLLSELLPEEADRIRLLWDEILDILMERVGSQSVPRNDLRHLNKELHLILGASRGKKVIRTSVIDVLMVLLVSDGTIQDFSKKLTYNDSTIYRALETLECCGLAQPTRAGQLAHTWTIDKTKFPIIYAAVR